jgi:hypothetical protein
MILKKFKTSFEFVDNRNYVHSSTILTFIASVLSSMHENEFYLIKKIKFRSEVNKNGTLVLANSFKDLDGIKDIKFDFDILANDIALYGYFVEDLSHSIINNIQSNYNLKNHKSNNFLGGKSSFEISKFSDSIYADMIQFNKIMHVSSFKDRHVKKISNVLMQNVPIWTNFDKLDFTEISCKNLFIRESIDGIMTLNQINLKEVSRVFTLEISFFLTL